MVLVVKIPSRECKHIKYISVDFIAFSACSEQIRFNHLSNTNVTNLVTYYLVCRFHFHRAYHPVYYNSNTKMFTTLYWNWYQMNFSQMFVDTFFGECKNAWTIWMMRFIFLLQREQTTGVPDISVLEIKRGFPFITEQVEEKRRYRKNKKCVKTLQEI